MKLMKISHMTSDAKVLLYRTIAVHPAAFLMPFLSMLLRVCEESNKSSRQHPPSTTLSLPNLSLSNPVSFFHQFLQFHIYLLQSSLRL